ncbi:MAG TPA: bifunctional shikimate kinase/3-dehydroquinate synthase [Solirubrobacteraceae bacterium]|nr:bifunctional shikimate kinase/3-dehydroquinate synthase [Solirubrobacteraceae bacterium]
MAAALKPALVFIGFMGAGKSRAAREAAAVLGVSADDADALLEAQLGEPIQAFFARDGEGAFRAIEEELAGALLETADGGVIALGGGALGSERVRAALARHLVVLLDVDLDTAWARAHESERPLARERSAFAALYEARGPVYDAAADAVLPATGVGVVTRALDALQALPEGHRLLWATSASGDYPVWVGPLERSPWPDRGRRLVISDETVAELHAARIPEPAGLVEIPAGEEHKTLQTAERIWRALVAQGATRTDHVVALGGGVVGDLAGFCAATYQRGVAVVQVPTTLVAQVDSAYGGKTGVDLPEAKNYVGAYHQPIAVLTDPALLQTLAPQELAAGYAEVVKTALIAGGALWDRVAAGAPIDDEVIVGCVRTKLRVVAVDERDGGARQALNLGHTVGHAIETVTGYARYRHGEAVGLGLLAALRLSGQDALRELVEQLLSSAGLPTRMEGVDAAAVAEATARDKKRTGEAVPYVLVDAPGRVSTGHAVGAPELLAAVRELSQR